MTACKGGYICVGWDDVGDLREFDFKQSFQERCEKESGELWTLIELEPGDVVVAAPC